MYEQEPNWQPVCRLAELTADIEDGATLAEEHLADLCEGATARCSEPAPGWRPAW